MTPKKECIVSLSLGNSIFIIASTFLGSHYHSTWDQRPKNKTSEYLNCRFSSFSRSPFFPVVSRNRIKFLLCFCYSSVLPQKIMLPTISYESWKSYEYGIKFLQPLCPQKAFPIGIFLYSGQYRHSFCYVYVTLAANNPYPCLQS